MHEKLPLVIGEAQEIATKSADLVLKLQEIVAMNVKADNGNTDNLIYIITIFTLACFVGYYLMGRVTSSLHSSLISLANVLLGVVIIAAVTVVSSVNLSLSSVIGFFAVFLVAVNIVAAIVMTERLVKTQGK